MCAFFFFRTGLMAGDSTFSSSLRNIALLDGSLSEKLLEELEGKRRRSLVGRARAIFFFFTKKKLEKFKPIHGDERKQMSSLQ